MKILFSADWHLGHVLRGANEAPRLDDQLRQIRKIADYAVEHEADVLAIAGDVFEAQEKGPARVVAQSMMEALRPALDRGMRIIAIAGNHDRDYFMETANTWLSVRPAGAGEQLHFVTRPRLLTLEAGGDRVNFALLPFPYPSRYDVNMDDATSAVSRNQIVATRFIEEMERLQAEAAEMRLPTVLLTHVTVAGSSVGPYKIAPSDDVMIPRNAFPEFELTVIGHIHKAEQLGSGHFYYVGALDRMDLGERGYEPRVLLAEIGAKGVRAVTSLPLDPTPFAEVVATSEEEMHAAAAAIARPADTLVKLRLLLPPGAYPAPMLALARPLFPRLYGNVEIEYAADPATTAPADPSDAPPIASVRATVEWYFARRELPDEERAALLALTDELLRGAP